MLKRALAAVVVARLVLAPWAGAADVPTEASPAGPIAAAASREAARAAAATRGPMPGGLKWTGIGLIGLGGLLVPIVQFGDCTLDEFSCRDERAAARVAAGVLAGTGALLLVIGHHKRAHLLPSVAVGPGRATIQQRITF